MRSPVGGSLLVDSSLVAESGLQKEGNGGDSSDSLLLSVGESLSWKGKEDKDDKSASRKMYEGERRVLEDEDSPVNFFPLTRGSPLGDLVFLKTAGAWQTAAVIFLAL